VEQADPRIPRSIGEGKGPMSTSAACGAGNPDVVAFTRAEADMLRELLRYTPTFSEEGVEWAKGEIQAKLVAFLEEQPRTTVVDDGPLSTDEGRRDITTASRRILSLDADGDAAPPTEGTWRRATDFLVTLASAVGDPIHRLGKPRIWRGPDRSIDLYWETGETQLVFNVSAAGEATYYGSGPTWTIKGMTRVGLVDVDAGLLEAVRGLAEGAR